MRSRIFLVLLLVIVVTLSLVAKPVVARQRSSSYSPDGGPPGTLIYIQCFGSFAYYTYDSEQYDSSGERFYIELDANAQAIIEVPADARVNSSLEIFCGGDIEFPNRLGTFNVTDCVLGNSDYFTTISLTPLTRQQNGGQRYTARDVGIDSSGFFARTIDLTNIYGENLRVIVRSADIARLLDYLNNLSLDFKVDTVSPSQLDPRGCSNSIGFLRDPQPDGSVFMGDVDIELVLLQSTFVTAGSLYVVSYEIDPELDNDQVHTYRPRRTSAASAQVTADRGRVKLTMWNDASNYLNAIVLGSSLPKLPALMNSVAPDQANYYSVVRGMDAGNQYTMRGSFGTQPCDPDRDDCGEVVVPEIRLAQGGTGMTNGARMNDGNFQVEGYCNQGYIAGYSGITRDDYDWYCTSGNSRYRLTQNDFTTICQITYDDPNAIAISDRGQSVPALNWRCFTR